MNVTSYKLTLIHKTYNNIANLVYKIAILNFKNQTF